MQFKWTPECENCFQILKEFLQQAPILQYPDPQASYTLYTDASKFLEILGKEHLKLQSEQLGS